MKKFLFILIVLISACKGSRMSNQNLSYLYNPLEVDYIPNYILFNNSDSISTVFFKINTKSLLYIKNELTQKFEAKFCIQAELFDSYEMKVVLDSVYKDFSDDDNVNYNDFWGNFRIRAKFPENTLLKVTFRDINKHYDVDSYIDVLKSKRYNVQSFLLLNSDSFPMTENFIHDKQEFRLLCNDTAVNKLYVRYYNRSFPIAAPPFSTVSQKPFNFTADSVFSIPLKGGYTPLITLPDAGFYHFQVDTSLQQGFTLFRFDEDYPFVTNPLQMLYSLRYLTSKSEYDDMLVMKNKKQAVEKFWIERGGNADRAKELIRLYYNRVQEANRLFKSYLEGWKTDRGIIYIVYGPPNLVYRSENSENWVYGEDRNMLSINFTFYKVSNPFSENDYSLNRSPLYKDGWFMAVDNWRR